MFREFYKDINFDPTKELWTQYKVTQGDTKSRGLTVTLDLGGAAGSTAAQSMRFFAVKPDNTTVFVDAHKDGDKFIVDFTNQVLAAPGVVVCSLVLYGSDGEKIADKKFKMLVESSLEDGAVISVNERGILDRAFELAEDIVPRLELLDLSEALRVTAELSREEAEALREESHEAFLNLSDRVDTIITTPVEGVSAQEIIDARGGEATLGARVNGVVSQLADKEKELGLEGWELQNKKRKLTPLITFVDDDAYPAVLTKLKPLSETYNIPMVTAAISSRVEQNSSYSMTKEQLLNLQSMGWEISCHTHTHGHLAEKTYAEQEYELSHSKELFDSWGLKVTTLCYPFSSYDDNTIEIARKYFRCGRKTDGGGKINRSPLETWDIVSMPLGSYFDTWSSPPFATNTLEYYKWNVDKAVANNGWLVIMTHCSDAMHDATQQSYLEQTIQYVKSLNIDVVTLDEGLNRRGNIIDIGRYLESYLRKKHLVVGADGTYSGSDLQNIVTNMSANAIVNSTLPKDIPKNKIILSNVFFSEAAGLPENNAGQILTMSYATTTEEGTIRQQYRVISKGTVYERYSINDTAWSDWQPINVVQYYPTNTFAFTTPLTGYPKNTVSRCRISAYTGAPEAKEGILTTDYASGHTYYIWQTYEVTESANTYKRYWINTTSAWSEWVRITPLARTTTQRNSATFLKNIGGLVFDTTLGKPIWWNGTNWVDSNGVTV